MDSQPLTSHQVADLLVRLPGPYHPDRVVDAAWTVDELVRRLNHATIDPTTLLDPRQVNRTIAGLRSALQRLEQTLDQIAGRLDTLATDPRVEHTTLGKPPTACREAADQLRQAAAHLGPVTAPLTKAGNITDLLRYDTAPRAAFPHPEPASEPLPPVDPVGSPSGPQPPRRSR